MDEGRVRVSRLPGYGPAGDGVSLGAGEAARYQVGEAIARLGVDDVATTTAWREGKLGFVDRPLRAVVSELDRYRPGAIVLLGSTIAAARFSGLFDVRDTDRALAAVEAMLPVDVVHLMPYLTLLRARD